jgi:sporulation protein YlmC with PRC-barrel domain
MSEHMAGDDFRNRTIVDNDGEKIGKVEELYQDHESGQAEWALVHTGLFGMKKTFVPLRGAQADGENVRVPIEKAQVKEAPHIEPDGELSEAEEQWLFEHYGVPYTGEGSTTATGAPTAGASGRHDPGRGGAAPGRLRLRKVGVVPQERVGAQDEGSERVGAERDERI